MDLSYRKFVRENFDKLKDTIQVPNNTTNAGEVQSYPLIHFKMPYKDVKLWGQRLSYMIYLISYIVFTVSYSDKDRGGILNPVLFEGISIHDYKSINEIGYGVARAWLLSKSALKEVRFPRITCYI